MFSFIASSKISSTLSLLMSTRAEGGWKSFLPSVVWTLLCKETYYVKRESVSVIITDLDPLYLFEVERFSGVIKGKCDSTFQGISKVKLCTLFLELLRVSLWGEGMFKGVKGKFRILLGNLRNKNYPPWLLQDRLWKRALRNTHTHTHKLHKAAV